MSYFAKILLLVTTFVLCSLGVSNAESDYYVWTAEKDGVIKKLVGKFDRHEAAEHRLYFLKQNNAQDDVFGTPSNPRFFIPDNSLAPADREFLEKKYNITLPGANGIDDSVSVAEPTPVASSHNNTMFDAPVVESVSPVTSPEIVPDSKVIPDAAKPLTDADFSNSAATPDTHPAKPKLNFWESWLVLIPGFMLFGVIQWFISRRRDKKANEPTAESSLTTTTTSGRGLSPIFRWVIFWIFVVIAVVAHTAWRAATRGYSFGFWGGFIPAFLMCLCIGVLWGWAKKIPSNQQGVTSCNIEEKPKMNPVKKGVLVGAVLFVVLLVVFWPTVATEMKRDYLARRSIPVECVEFHGGGPLCMSYVIGFGMMSSVIGLIVWAWAGRKRND